MEGWGVILTFNRTNLELKLHCSIGHEQCIRDTFNRTNLELKQFSRGG